MTPRPAGRPDPDGHHDDLSAEDLDGLSQLVPDDARELSAESDAWRREATQQRQPTPFPPATRVRRSPSRRHRLSMTAGLMVFSMLVVALSGVVGALVLPASPSGPPPAPLASVTPLPGQVGGLLPAATLADGSSPVSARSVRPAIVALVPVDCEPCADLLREVRRQGAEFSLPVTLVGGSDQGAQLSDLERALGAYRLDVLTDPAGTLATTYGPTVLTLLLVRDDGVVADIVRDPPPDLRLESTLVSLTAEWTA
jgi:hypothetical protein